MVSSCWYLTTSRNRRVLGGAHEYRKNIEGFGVHKGEPGFDRVDRPGAQGAPQNRMEIAWSDTGGNASVVVGVI